MNLLWLAGFRDMQREILYPDSRKSIPGRPESQLSLQKTPEELAEEVRAACGDAFWLLLAHRNNYFEKQYSSLGADLVISGHGHGGLIRLPFTDGLISVERTLFPSYTSGFYQFNGRDVFVSRGLGNSGPSFRLFNRPQLVTLTLEKE